MWDDYGDFVMSLSLVSHTLWGRLTTPPPKPLEEEDTAQLDLLTPNRGRVPGMGPDAAAHQNHHSPTDAPGLALTSGNQNSGEGPRHEHFLLEVPQRTTALETLEINVYCSECKK